jgi:hypothetical protein
MPWLGPGLCHAAPSSCFSVCLFLPHPAVYCLLPG